MPDPEILVGLAALGLTVTGFSGLIAVLGRRSSGEWTEAERFQLGELIVVSLAVTFASFIPILVGLVMPEASALKWSTLLVAAAHLVVLVRGVFRNYSDGAAPTKMPNAIALTMVVGGFLLIVGALLAGFGLIGGGAFFLVANLLWQLLVATIHFVALLMNSGGVVD